MTSNLFSKHIPKDTNGYEQKDINFLVIVAKNANENGPSSRVAKDPRVLHKKMLKFYFSHSSQKCTHNKD